MTGMAGADKLVFICGSALRGQPDHVNLQNAKFVQEAKTAPRYRLHSVQNGWHPGIYEVETEGVAIIGELYAMTAEQYEHLVSTEPPHMYPEAILLDSGDEAIAMLYPKALIDEHGWPDISHFGSWAAYKATQ